MEMKANNNNNNNKMKSNRTSFRKERLGDEGSDRIGSESEDFVLSSSNIEDGEDVIAKEETQAVFQQKLVVVLVLVCSTIGVATAIFLYVSNNERTQFETKFKDDAQKVLDAIGNSFDRTLGAFDSLSVALVSYAHVSNSTWPFVTMPDYAWRMSKVLPLSDAISVNYFPIVTPARRKEWEAYSARNDNHVNEGMAIQETWEGYYGPVIYNATHNHIVHGDFGNIADNVSRVMLPSWQCFPVIPNTTFTYGFDWLSIAYPQDILASLGLQQAIVSLPFLTHVPLDNPLQAFQQQVWADYFSTFIPPTEESYEPVSHIFYPIVDPLHNDPSEGLKNNGTMASQVVGLVSGSIYWRSTIRKSLPKGSEGIQVVVTNPCASNFTYQINGQNTVYLGDGDLHDPAYDALGFHSSLSSLEKSATQSIVYTGLPLGDFCPLTLHVYPSDHMKAAFTTGNRFVFTAMSVCIFAFTSLVFFLYERKVERRQETVLDTAVRSTAIVSSLFPATVRDQIYQENETEKQKHIPTKLTEDVEHNRPIASLYDNTTIMFADIAGFTAWSAKRQPVQVFELLETLYRAFDAIALRRKVFKVETIGDCYVAVAGLPDPQADHAVIMTKFADDCMTKMSLLTAELVATLGDDTANLAMRVGLHSGSVTGGVLRGQKSRFQLFGDTMNTASRMESNGLPNRIHASQETADALIAKGKSAWITPRDDKIVAKGKGELQTFWVSIRKSDVASVMSSSKASGSGYGGAEIASLSGPKNESEHRTFEI